MNFVKQTGVDVVYRRLYSTKCINWMTNTCRIDDLIVGILSPMWPGPPFMPAHSPDVNHPLVALSSSAKSTMPQ